MKKIRLLTPGVWAGLLALSGPAAHCAQASHSEKVEFDVASVKTVPATANAHRRQLPWPFQGGVEGVGGRVTMHNRALADLVSAAYSVDVSLVSGPEWATEQLYDVDAKLPEGASYTDAPGMLRLLLEKRFGLVLHKEMRAEPGYYLVVARGGAHLKAWTSHASIPSDSDMTPQQRAQEAIASIKASGGKTPVCVGRASLAKLAKAISGVLRGPVIDKTGMEGDYEMDFRLPLGAYLRVSRMGEEPSQSFLDEVHKLGLDLRNAKVEVEEVVIDRARRFPDPN
jgi:uncharacterized protein (TIGR03435 family)